MTNEEILKKAIEHARQNGWHQNWNSLPDLNGHIERVVKDNFSVPYGWMRIIFSHDFAKAFWGETKLGYKEEYGPTIENLGWRHRLQFMVLEEDPLQYLAKFL